MKASDTECAKRMRRLSLVQPQQVVAELVCFRRPQSANDAFAGLMFAHDQPLFTIRIRVLVGRLGLARLTLHLGSATALHNRLLEGGAGMIANYCDTPMHVNDAASPHVAMGHVRRAREHSLRSSAGTCTCGTARPCRLDRRAAATLAEAPMTLSEKYRALVAARTIEADPGAGCSRRQARRAGAQPAALAPQRATA